jgi:hypothetical protein
LPMVNLGKPPLPPDLIVNYLPILSMSRILT